MKTKRQIFFSAKNLALASLLLCFQLSTNAAVPGDTLKNKFDINDPRNPHCPCHKYQKIADEEYKKLLASTSRGNGLNLTAHDLSSGSDLYKPENNSSGNSSSESSATKELRSKKNFHLFKIRHKNRSKQHPELKKIFDVKHWKIWKGFKRLDSCYHF